MSAPARPRASAARDPSCLVLLEEDLSPQLDDLLRELLSGGHHLQIEHHDGHGPASFAVGDGLRLYGDASASNTRTIRAVLGRSIQGADHDFQLDLSGLDYLALMSWAAVLQSTQSFRNQGGMLRVHARGSIRRLLAMPTVVESDRTNLELT